MTAHCQKPDNQTMTQINVLNCLSKSKISSSIKVSLSHILLPPKLFLLHRMILIFYMRLAQTKAHLEKYEKLFCGKRKLSLSPPGVTKLLGISIIARMVTEDASTHTYTFTFIALITKTGLNTIADQFDLVFLNINHKLNNLFSPIIFSLVLISCCWCFYVRHINHSSVKLTACWHFLEFLMKVSGFSQERLCVPLGHRTNKSKRDSNTV